MDREQIINNIIEHIKSEAAGQPEHETDLSTIMCLDLYELECATDHTNRSPEFMAQNLEIIAADLVKADIQALEGVNAAPIFAPKRTEDRPKWYLDQMYDTTWMADHIWKEGPRWVDCDQDTRDAIELQAKEAERLHFPRIARLAVAALVELVESGEVRLSESAKTVNA